ncbi:MAG: glutamate-5-semialdehyde dehydrogenase [Candidatus Harrisonbacteria bacterium CG10_big_fil_rev_8_21_14_0_10_49_15]|uniref:Gamma-glutamyl phosphate reductase n=1 Tax=Candidatus Harrisonbacteria bacterium CG10_big_fil_rev_8_21_14_0_10_49_15 TaxID=1974587 RepID=A0A2H0ULV3_9BACT|nr:MAG: glutamate-5-semialdehyde dehydrogenase [Candidatus Harrisonbacteria bacterium CG10_big_fil_rev_8_21_14_0_10_49_15]
MNSEQEESSVLTQAEQARQAFQAIRRATTEQKNNFLNKLADLLEENIDTIISENKRDLESTNEITKAMLRRLELTKTGIQSIARGVRDIAKAEDPVGSIIKAWVRPNGLRIKRVRVPIGVIAVIFESRPNVIIDVAALCIKSGNAVIVRGGKEAMYSNNILARYITQALRDAGLPENAAQQLQDRRYEAISELVQLEDYLDLVIPRGRESLIKAVSEKARVPVMKHMRGLCHLYIDKDADIDKAIKIAVNAKTSNPSTCNTIETILVHKDIADSSLPKLLSLLREKKVEIRGCSQTCTYSSACVAATETDWATEYLDLIISIKVVESYEAGVKHIQKYSSGLTDSIVTENIQTAEEFIKDINSATVLVNASNRFTDGGEFGLGAEIGISTSSIHMRGPMGLEDLTVPRYVVMGSGQIRE